MPWTLATISVNLLPQAMPSARLNSESTAFGSRTSLLATSFPQKTKMASATAQELAVEDIRPPANTPADEEKMMVMMSREVELPKVELLVLRDDNNTEASPAVTLSSEHNNGSQVPEAVGLSAELDNGKSVDAVAFLKLTSEPKPTEDNTPEETAFLKLVASARQPAPSILREYTAADVASHKTASDTWIVIDGNIYDVSKFQEEHPGGPKVIAGVAGKDATKKFDKYHRRAILEQQRYKDLRVGKLGVGKVDGIAGVKPDEAPRKRSFLSRWKS